MAAAQLRTALEAKKRAQWQARAALAGVALHITEDDRGMPLFIASRWAMTRQMSTAEEVERFLKLIGAPSV